jgi:hypothetical protein
MSIKIGLLSIKTKFVHRGTDEFSNTKTFFNFSQSELIFLKKIPSQVYCACLIALTLAQDYHTQYNTAPVRQAPLRLNSPETAEKAAPIAILKQINK